MKKDTILYLPRIIALGVLLVGAVSSLGFVLRAGESNHSVLLKVLFTGWVLLPYLVLIYAGIISTRWSVPIRIILYSVILVVTLGSFLSYSGMWGTVGAKPAAVFLIVPMVSWVLMSIVTTISRPISRIQSRKNGNV